MKTYTEEDLRTLASLIDEAYRPYTSNNVFGGELVEEFISGEIPAKEPEKTYPFTYFTLEHKLGWTDFCELTGIDYYATRNGYEIKDDEIFNITESKAKEYGLI